MNNAYIDFLTRNMVDEGAVVIQPKHIPESELHKFVEQLRQMPANISVREGVNPFHELRRADGQLVVAWIPKR